MKTNMPTPLILASTSRYRAELFTRLALPFAQVAPGVDESPHPRETPLARARRLAGEKAMAVARRPETMSGTLVIGSDQVAVCEGNIVLDKPGTLAKATAQLRTVSGKTVAFLTAVAVVEAAGDGEARLVGVKVDTTLVHFRRLSRELIARYLAAEPALDCAGSFKAEGLGLALTTGMQTRDPTALVGLPLIDTLGLLRRAGVVCP